MSFFFSEIRYYPRSKKLNKIQFFTVKIDKLKRMELKQKTKTRNKWYYNKVTISSLAIITFKMVLK